MILKRLSFILRVTVKYGSSHRCFNTAEKAGLAGDAIYSVVQFQVFFSLVNLTYYPLGDTAF